MKDSIEVWKNRHHCVLIKVRDVGYKIDVIVSNSKQEGYTIGNTYERSEAQLLSKGFRKIILRVGDCYKHISDFTPVQIKEITQSYIIKTSSIDCFYVWHFLENYKKDNWCVNCGTSKIRFTIHKNRSRDGRCWSCYEH